MTKKNKFNIELTKAEIETFVACICECWEDGTDNMKKNSIDFIFKVKDIMGFEKINTKEDVKEMIDTFTKALAFKSV